MWGRVWLFSRQHPQDAVELLLFEEAHRETHVLPPGIWFRILATQL